MLFQRIQKEVAGDIQPLSGNNRWQMYASVLDCAEYSGILRGISQARAFYALADSDGFPCAMTILVPEAGTPEEQEAAFQNEANRLMDVGVIVTHIAVPEIARAYAVCPDRADFDWRH